MYDVIMKSFTIAIIPILIAVGSQSAFARVIDSDPENIDNYELSMVNTSEGQVIQFESDGRISGNHSTQTAIADINFLATATDPDGAFHISAKFKAAHEWTVTWRGIGVPPSTVKVKAWTVLWQSTPFPTDHPTSENVGGSDFKIYTTSQGVNKAESNAILDMKLSANGVGKLTLKGKNEIYGSSRQFSDIFYTTGWDSSVRIATKAVRLRPAIQPTTFCEWIGEEPVPKLRPTDYYTPVQSDLFVNNFGFLPHGNFAQSAFAKLVGLWENPSTTSYEYKLSPNLYLESAVGPFLIFYPNFSTPEYKNLFNGSVNASINVNAQDDEGSMEGAV